jgi:hypothetical protein
MGGFLGLEDFIRVVQVRQSYGRAHPKEQPDEQKERQEKVRERR